MLTFYAPRLKGLPGASSNPIICLSVRPCVRRSVRLSICLSVIAKFKCLTKRDMNKQGNGSDFDEMSPYYKQNKVTVKDMSPYYKHLTVKEQNQVLIK